LRSSSPSGTGAAVGDLVAEQVSLGYLTTLLRFVAVSAELAIVWSTTTLNGVVARMRARAIRPLASLADRRA